MPTSSFNRYQCLFILFYLVSTLSIKSSWKYMKQKWARTGNRTPEMWKHKGLVNLERCSNFTIIHFQIISKGQKNWWPHCGIGYRKMVLPYNAKGNTNRYKLSDSNLTNHNRNLKNIFSAVKEILCNAMT